MPASSLALDGCWAAELLSEVRARSLSFSLSLPLGLGAIELSKAAAKAKGKGTQTHTRAPRARAKKKKNRPKQGKKAPKGDQKKAPDKGHQKKGPTKGGPEKGQKGQKWPRKASKKAPKSFFASTKNFPCPITHENSRVRGNYTKKLSGNYFFLWANYTHINYTKKWFRNYLRNHFGIHSNGPFSDLNGAFHRFRPKGPFYLLKIHWKAAHLEKGH